jgi:Tfp pilus assembly protein PilF
VSDLASMRFFLGMLVALVGFAGVGFAQGETLAERRLKELIARQKELLAEAAQENPHFDESNFRLQMEQLASGYEEWLRANPKNADGYAAYGYLLSKLDQRKHAIAMLMKANQLNPDLPLVKNQIGNWLAEEGRPLDAVSYYMAAIKLAPEEPLYHYQLGTLLYEARDEFLKSGEWQRDAIDRAIHEAFKKAAELAPDRIEFTYRHAESFYHKDPPDWEGALAAWKKLEAEAPTTIERETMRLHIANVLGKMGRVEEGRAVLEEVKEDALQQQKEKLLKQWETRERKTE